MATESKYNLNVPQIPDGEPIILFRAKDITLPALLASYATLCRLLGSPSQHIDHIEAMRRNVMDWQAKNLDKVRAPD